MIRLQSPILMRPEDLGLMVADRNQDIHGWIVIDVTGKEVGNVKDLLIDTEEHKVRFLRVGFGGFFGMGGHTFLVPADAITSIEAKTVNVDLTRKIVIDGPKYDPLLIQTHTYPRDLRRGPVDLDPVYPRYPHQWR